MFQSVEGTQRELASRSYLADVGLSTNLFLALRMEKALFLEGEPGVGKTEIAKVLSEALDAPLIRLQCYEGLDVSQAVYEWNYSRQLLELQARQAGGGKAGGPAPSHSASSRDPSSEEEAAASEDLFSPRFLLKRPLLQAIDPARDRAPVLLIDELDRADEEFESFLLELLSDYQVTVPEIGTIRARHKPVTIITSNRTREIHDALKRRCVYHWIDFPTHEREVEILRLKLPEIEENLARQVVAFVQGVRDQELYKLPGIAETLDWARALGHLNARKLDLETVERTLGFLLKYQDDIDKLRGTQSAELLQRAASE